MHIQLFIGSNLYLNHTLHPASLPPVYLQSACTALRGLPSPQDLSTPCAVFLEDRKELINESCVLITTSSLWSIFKGAPKRCRLGELLPSMG